MAALRMVTDSESRRIMQAPSHAGKVLLQAARTGAQVGAQVREAVLQRDVTRVRNIWRAGKDEADTINVLLTWTGGLLDGEETRMRTKADLIVHDAIATAFGEQLGYLDGQVQRRLEVNYRSEQVRVGATLGETTIEVLSFPSAMLFRLTPN